eukprot:TRINITY_DN15143_c0_g1_i1.p1 TRINITY_DN15143_c0_g1~~TRINITY_DN15143_c0_g1_i1.p1  ORF type:complete len:308 (+),score=107.03 TRINITY_DN15143_c0_g1_i1:57-926(+)
MEGPMCVVCGRVEVKGQMRRSGFKCATCIGKASKEALRTKPRQADFAGWLEVAASGKRKRRWVHAHPDGVAWFDDVQLRHGEAALSRPCDLRSEPQESAPVVAAAPAGCVLELTGESQGGWVRAMQRRSAASPQSPRPAGSPGGFADADVEKGGVCGWLPKAALRQPAAAARAEGIVPWIASSSNSRGGVAGHRTRVRIDPSTRCVLELSYFEPEKGDKASGTWRTLTLGAPTPEDAQEWFDYISQHVKEDRPLDESGGYSSSSPASPPAAGSPARAARRARPQPQKAD